MEWLGQHSCEHMSKSARKRKVKEYIDRVVWPAAMHRETVWWEDEEAKHDSGGTIVFADVVDASPKPTHEAVRAWTQLRLQRYITVRGRDAKIRCPLCNASSGATLEHLISECDAAWGAAGEVQKGASAALFDYPTSADEVDRAMQLSSSWGRAIFSNLNHHGSTREQSASLDGLG